MNQAEHATSFVGSVPRPQARGHQSLLALGVGGLVAAVTALMCLSLSGCQMFEGSGGSGPSSRSDKETGERGRGGSGLYRHVAPDAPTLSVAGVLSEPDIRVRIAAAVSDANISASLIGTSAKSGISPSGVVVIEAIGGRRGQAPSRGGGLRMTGPVRVVFAVGDWVVTDAAGARQRIAAEALELGPESLSTTSGSLVSPSSQITLGGVAYSGRLRLLPRTDITPAGTSSAFDVIEHVPLETYLRGVVIKEMYSNWPLEAFRVQAICARSYALHERVRATITGKGFDVEASQRDQAYAGSTSDRVVTEAVESTRGMVLAHQGVVLRAYYSSSCGGRNGAARDTWPTGPGFEYNLAAPIQSYAREYLCDKSCPKFTWVVVRDRDELVKRLRAYGETSGMLIRKLEGIASLEVVRQTATGRPAEYKIIEPGGRWFQIKAEDLRLACNTTAGSASSLSAIAAKDRVLSGDLAFKIIPAGAGSTKPKSQATGGKVEISGRGFGHGVGMCQYCAKSMADRGDFWNVMLNRFYPGAEQVRAYK